MRLEARVMLWIAVFLGAVAIALAVMARMETQRIERRWTEASQVVAETTADIPEAGMVDYSPRGIRTSMENVEARELVESVTVYRRTGIPWVTSNPDLTLSGSGKTALLSSMADNTVSSSGKGTLSVFVPVPKSSQCIGCQAEASDVLGAVEVRLDERPFQEDLVRNAGAWLVLAAILLVLGILASVWAIRKSVLRPLGDIGEAAQPLGEGDLSGRPPEYQGWEVAEVSSTSDEMVTQLEHQQRDLRETADELRSDLGSMEESRSLLTSGAGLDDVLQWAAATVGAALGASGVAIFRLGEEEASAVWGTLPAPAVAPGTAWPETTVTSVGDLGSVPYEEEIGWAVAPTRVGERVLALVTVGWEPPMALEQSERNMLDSLAGLVGVAVSNAELLERLQQKEQVLQGLMRRTLTVQEEERRRLSRELHDETSQVLSALIMNVGLLESQAPVDDASRIRIAAVKSLAEEAARNLDRMLFELRPALLDELGLMPALRWYVAQTRDLWGIRIDFEGAKLGRLPDHIELAAFRIVQEAISNCVRHARPSRVDVRVKVVGRDLHLEVDDDGVGFDALELSARARAGEAVGLEGMRERAEIVGGKLRVDSVPERGTRVAAELPLPEEGADAESEGVCARRDDERR